jgi:hypothetical protein
VSKGENYCFMHTHTWENVAYDSLLPLIATLFISHLLLLYYIHTNHHRRSFLPQTQNLSHSDIYTAKVKKKIRRIFTAINFYGAFVMSRLTMKLFQK